MKDILELVCFILFILIAIRTCDGCNKDVHTKHGIKGIGNHIIHGDSYNHEK